MEVEMTGKCVKRGAGYELEIPRKYHVNDQGKAVAWVTKKANLIIREYECVENRCLDKKKS